VLQARAACDPGTTTLVLPSDMPLLTTETFERLVEHHAATGAAVTLLTAHVAEPHGYGRVLRQRGRVTRIVEERDATDDEKRIGEINTAVYCFDGRRLWSALDKVRPDNDQGEYYLTDVVGIIGRAGGRVEAVTVQDPHEALGVNDRRQLAAVAAIQRTRILERLMEAGVTVIDPATTYIEDDVAIGADTIVYPQVVIEGRSTIGAECVIGAGSHLSACQLADRVIVKPYSILEQAAIEERAVLGPFCHLRPGCVIGAGAEIGNYAELKKSRVGRGSKMHHVSYVGDATVGDGVNIGAGTITCNYDGFRKHPTTIGDEAFIGTNSSLVAPVTIGTGAYVGAGSVITRDVPADALALERSKPVVREEWVEGWRRRNGAPERKKRKG
jgi:bifunctional UDP-N-acetylglucosamine pyrophosphorylase/glucosamine-1-phosphate N-acetyltransferase